jgi:hypothetical protein
MRASLIRACWCTETMPWVWKLHGAVCAPDVGCLIRCLTGEDQLQPKKAQAEQRVAGETARKGSCRRLSATSAAVARPQVPATCKGG